MMRLCPNCHTERPVVELFCEGEIDGNPCNWDLADLPVRETGWRPTPPPATTSPSNAARGCPNGHLAGAGDLICSVCGADVSDAPAAQGYPREEDRCTPAVDSEPPPQPTILDGWEVERRLDASSQVHERYIAVRGADRAPALLTLYAIGSEPDPEVYDALRTLSRAHVPELIATGRWNDRAYEITEAIHGGTLAELGLLPNDIHTFTNVLREVGSALFAMAEVGLRHRDLRPAAIQVRATYPLDLVITDFGSARLSEFDLDIVSPLEMTRYTAPEAVAGGVAAASDWWSLGMILLEQVTRGACFAGINDQAFLIHVLSNGADIPTGLDPRLAMLLHGLLTVDRRERWCWPQVQQWLAGEAPPVYMAQRGAASSDGARSIPLGGKNFTNRAAYSLAAADAPCWDEARQQFLLGVVENWAQAADFGDDLLRELRSISRLEEVSDDLRLSLALKALNPSLPLIVKGEIVAPGWLIEHPEDGYALISGPIPDLLERRDEEPWLGRLKRRMERVQERAKQLDVALSDDEFRVHTLSTSRARLAAIWADRRRLLPDTDHPGLLAILERRLSADEDYILLLSAEPGQFRTADAIVAEAAATAARAGLADFDQNAAADWLARPRRELIATLEQRLEGFARCGLNKVDEWGDQFRLERRLPIERALVLLSIPQSDWQEPPKQQYVANLLDFFAKRVTSAVMRGPLTRLVIGKTTARLDLTELGTERKSAQSIIDHLLLRNGQTVDVDPAAFMQDPRVERRLRTLYSHATLYRRDTGIDGLYMGFPFLLMQEAKSTTRPRIAPVLLWPVKLSPELGGRGRVTIAFDRDREEVRINPAFETLLGGDAAERWLEAARDLLSRATLSASDVMDGFAELGRLLSRQLQALPGRDTQVRRGDDQLACAAALFHLAYVGQAVMEDLRQLKQITPAGSSLETALRVGESPVRAEAERGREIDRYFTADSDPSQEQAVFEARSGRGLLVEGPPGTGKSQTIVNMVADAIGRESSMLIVCQKQAALEVVHKRLQAEGLGDRIVMINDVNRDRLPIIRSLREQLDAVFGRRESGAQLRQQRQQLASRIEALEGELDRYHGALHKHDEATGLTYRLILSDLIGLQDGRRPATDVPSLRGRLADLNVGEVATLQEVCGPLARVWLPSRYENSPLAALEQFSADQPTIAAVSDAFQCFEEQERARAQIIERTPKAFPVVDPAPYREWAREHAEDLLQLDDAARSRLADWLPLLWPQHGDPAAQSILAETAEIADALNQLQQASDGAAASVAVSLSDEELLAWVALADEFVRTPTFFERLSPLRWLRSRRLQRCLRERGLVSTSGFHQAVHCESKLRPWRMRALAVLAVHGDGEADLHSAPPADLASAMREFETHMTQAKRRAAAFAAHPNPGAARATARAGSRSALDDLIDHAEQGLARFEARRVSIDALADLEPWFGSGWVTARREAILAGRETTAETEPVREALPNLAAYQRFRARADQLDERALIVFRALRAAEAKLAEVPIDELDREVRRIVGREARLAWKSRLENESPELLIEASELQAKAEVLAVADKEMRRLNRRLLADGVDARHLRPAREWEDVTRLQGQRARRLREVMDRGPDLGLMSLRPVWLMNPDVASRVLPLKKALFDTVVYDEASQMPIEYALPTLFRSRRMIVSGDEKQMPPTAFFASRVENDEAELFDGQEPDENASEEDRDAVQETWNRREIKDCPDLLQLAKTVLPPTTLQIHYRSVYRELIQFSNASFYANRLSIPARHPEAEVRRVRPIEVVRVDGVYENQTNLKEARQVVEEVARTWDATTDRRKTVGVVTFNRKQADAIEEELEARAERDPHFRSVLAQERERIEEGEDMGFFVKNVENVQGDERDIMIFSSTFGRNGQGTFRRSFGVLGQAGGERRLNVAVTRAREKVVLVTSMPVAEISDLLNTRRQASSARDYLQAYFEYARALSAGELENANALLARLAPEDRTHAFKGGDEADGFAAAVAAEIRRLGWNPVPANGAGAFGLDFAIEDSRTGLYGIGIECDAPRHSLLEFARAREIWRPAVLRRSIPVIHRVSSQGWLSEPERESRALELAIAGAMNGAVV